MSVEEKPIPTFSKDLGELEQLHVDLTAIVTALKQEFTQVKGLLESRKQEVQRYRELLQK